jgi:RNA polymerase sigma-70 factor (ECF subfamily)
MEHGSAPPAADGPEAQTERAFLELRSRLRGFVGRRMSRGPEPDDLVQTVFLRLHENLRERRRIRDVSAWLFAAARNLAIDEYRSAWRRRVEAAGDLRELPERPAEAATPGGNGEDGLASAARCLPHLLTRLPARDRSALERVALGGESPLQASRAEGLSLAGMKARFQRARARLKALYVESCRVGLDGGGRLASCEPKGPRGAGPCGGGANRPT